MTGLAPRLRVERLVIVESHSSATFIRDVRLRAGLNIVWAEELTSAEGATEVERAGHGVGKSTFSLMLRAVLGDDGAAVKTMRNHLAEFYGSGGIAAEVVVGEERFAVLRSFGQQSFALRNATVEELFGENSRAGTVDFSAYVAALGEQACLQNMPTRALPVTGQAVEWAHVLCWIARDQALGLRQYFEWRKDDGTGLRRKVMDPPALMRLVLGLLGDSEAKAEKRIATINGELSRARDTLRSEEQRGTNTRSIVETQLRVWAGVSNSLQMVADDLFAESVETEIKRKATQLETKNDEDRALIATLDRELVEHAADIKTQERIAGLARGRWDETVALRTKDDKWLKEIRERRDELLTLSGMCQYGRVSYTECSYVQTQRDAVALTAKRYINVLTKTIELQGDREATEKADYEREAKSLGTLMDARQKRNEQRATLSLTIERRLRQLGEGDAVRRTLRQWQESQQAPETEKLRKVRAVVLGVEKELETAKGAKVAAQQQVSEREQQITTRVAELAEVFGVKGRFMPSDEKRPFQMLGADGDAYTVLEILLGDLACAADGASGGGAHPGLLIFDCPREREMSPHLYDRFLALVDETCNATPGLQVILTTTTPPPGLLREPPTRILKLSRASDHDLLLKRRVENLLARAMPPSHDMADEEDE
ncbi:hypothetical protein R69746_07816 [Paraburkholderia aspalathi]|uniref:hypothetical protein n=1 Tax=Paraburkholderia aspalathi TaxID=1324617 RepID=UPI00190B85C7|nr:hypothetical protein [Paraburkholderia aspalathi]MBK3843798.1 hypothetical protein [Paraburkholderia aspalathi]CAE6861047.1 hypothetical protein R69746_07816 [Paraburkholderia aspalathi]